MAATDDERPSDEEAVRRFGGTAFKRLAKAGEGLFGSVEDTRQEAVLAALKAHRKHDPSRGGWAAHMSAQVPRECADALRGSRHRHTRDAKKAARAAKELRRRGEEPTDEAVAALTGMTPQEVARELAVLNTDRSLARPDALDDDAALRIEDDGIDVAEEATQDHLERAVSIGLLKSALVIRDADAPPPTPEEIEQGALGLLSVYFTQWQDFTVSELAAAREASGGYLDDIYEATEVVERRLKERGPEEGYGPSA